MLIFIQGWTLPLNPKKVGSKAASFTADEDELVKGSTKSISKQRIIQILGRIVLPSVTAAFVLIYIFAAAYLYTHPALKYD